MFGALVLFLFEVAFVTILPYTLGCLSQSEPFCVKGKEAGEIFAHWFVGVLMLGGLFLGLILLYWGVSKALPSVLAFNKIIVSSIFK